MKIKLSDYVAFYLVDRGISHCFTVTGGGAMYLNDAFGHKEGLTCIYNHHEQASAIAAEAYARVNNELALVCVTTGPGGTNALTGVVGAYLDSIPMLVISGQVRYDTTARYQNQFTKCHPLRSVGDQEFDITPAVKTMTKYAVMLEDPNQIKYVLKKALYLATHGRPGPCWIDIPVNFQSAIIETDDLVDYDESEDEVIYEVKDQNIDEVISLLKEAKRPVLYVGNGVRIAGAVQAFKELLKKIDIPVCTYWEGIDLIETDHPLYVGRAGNMGDRPGNFAVQNADLILAIGNRLSIRNVSYRYETWAREAKVIMVDIDEAELLKKTVHVDMPIHTDAKLFIERLNERIKTPIDNHSDWLKQCALWKEKYPVVLSKHYEDSVANVYACYDMFSRKLPKGSMTISSNGSCCVMGHQSWFIKEDDRFLMNNAIASMGYGLPAAIGACVANDRKQVICLEGDGSIMMNLQELQTIVTNNLPIKILLINNNGYHSIRQTQTNVFPTHTKVGIGPESNDLSFPDYRKLSRAFGIPYYYAHTNDEFKRRIARFLKVPCFALFELFVSPTQNFEPKNSAKVLPNGQIYSPPLEDLEPFLPKEELEENMYIPLLEEEV